MRALGCLTLFVLCLGAGSEQEKDGLQPFQGRWLLVGAKDDGKEVDVQRDNSPKIVFKGDRIFVNDEPMFRFSVDLTCNPKTIDLTVLDRNESREGIYRFDGKTLTIGLHNVEGVKMRPVTFTEGGALTFTLEKAE
jgi:uncharacterized protein (TIGR03067 family)